MAEDHPVALVTGAGSGIGRAISVRLSRANHRLVLAGRTLRTLEETGSQLPGPWLAVRADVADADSVSAMVDQAMAHFGRLDVLVNNAGRAPAVPIAESDPELIREVFAINALGPAWAIARAWPIFLEQGRGCVVNISSMATADPFPGLYAYAAAKGAVNVMVKSCMNERGEADIRAFAVAPGAVETAMLRAIVSESDLPPEDTLDPDEVAEVVVDCVLGRRDEQAGETIYMT